MKNDVKILKLSTGEEVIARVTEQRDLLELDNPMTLQAIPTNQQGQMGFALVPWLMSGKSTDGKCGPSFLIVCTCKSIILLFIWHKNRGF